MKLLFIIIFTITTAIESLKAQPESIWQLLQDGSIIRWAYTDGDEFNGPSLNESVWSYHYPWQYSDCSEFYTNGNNYEFSYNNTIESETIKLISKEETIQGHKLTYCPDGSSDIDNCLIDGIPNLRWYNYTSGMIFSKRQFKYGLFEIRFKLPIGKGLVPAFWLLGINPDEEFDIFEYKGETPNKIHIDTHCPNGCNNYPGFIWPIDFGGWVTATGNFSDGFNTMMGEWEPDACFWYLNGQDFAIWLGNFNYQAHLIANVAVGAAGPCAFSPPFVDSSTPFPAVFEIDYIRVWSRLDCENDINISNYNQSEISPTTITGKNINISNFSISQDQTLHVIGTETITLGDGTSFNGDVEVKTVECPEPTKNPSFSKNNDSLRIISTNEKAVNISHSTTIANKENLPLLYVKIYPNPSDGKITIEFIGKIDCEVKIELIDFTGKVIFLSDCISSKSIDIDISQFSKGVYILKGTFNNNSITDRIILK
ncbi:MAG: T9SS type A sorting domain-containing protein [Bacteroidota bacterium]